MASYDAQDGLGIRRQVEHVFDSTACMGHDQGCVAVELSFHLVGLGSGLDGYRCPCGAEALGERVRADADLLLVGDAVVVGVGVQEAGAGRDLLLVGESVEVRVGVERIAAPDTHFIAVEDGVAVAVCRRRGEAVLHPVLDAVVVCINPMHCDKADEVESWT